MDFYIYIPMDFYTFPATILARQHYMYTPCPWRKLHSISIPMDFYTFFATSLVCLAVERVIWIDESSSMASIMLITGVFFLGTALVYRGAAAG